MKTTDEIGNRYGKLTIKKRAENTKSKGRGSWSCKCDCGQEIVIIGKLLRNGSKTHCGCDNTSRIIDLIGQKYNELIVVSFAGTNKEQKALWNCQCSCGKNVVVSNSSLKSGNTKSCGHIAENREYRPSRVPKGKTTWDGRFQNNKNLATKRKLEFLLTRQEYEKICANNCYYCNDPPVAKIFNTKMKFKESIEHHTIYAHGLDRVNSELGYTIDNVVTCCKFCNLAKNDLTQEQFFNNIKRLYENLLKEGKIK